TIWLEGHGVNRHGSIEPTLAMRSAINHVVSSAKGKALTALQDEIFAAKCGQFGFNDVQPRNSTVEKDNAELKNLLQTGTEAHNHLVLNIARMHISEDNPTNLTKLGEWSDTNGTMLLKNFKLSSDERPVLSIRTVVEPPFVFKNGTTFYGYCIDLLDEIAKRAEFDYTIKEPADKKFGNLQEDETWSGMIGELIDRTADMAVGPISITSERETVVDFTTPYHEYAGIQILMKKSRVQPDTFEFTTIFTGNVWALIGGALVVTGVLMTLFDTYSPYSYRNRTRDKKLDASQVFTPKESMWFTMGAFTQSGGAPMPRSFSTRVLVGGLWFFSFILMSAYTANLAAFLTNSRLTTPIKSLADLAAQKTIRYSTFADSSMQTYFRRMADIEKNFYEHWKNLSIGNEMEDEKMRSKYAVWEYPLGDKFSNMWRNMRETGFVNSTFEGIKRVREERYAFLNEGPMVKYLAQKECDLEVIGDQFSLKPYGFAFQENSPLVENVNNIILQLQNERFLERRKLHWWSSPDQNKCKRSEDDNTGLTLSKVLGIFIIVVAGIALGLICLILECIWGKVVKKPKGKQNDENVTHPVAYGADLDPDCENNFAMHSANHTDSEHNGNPATINDETLSPNCSDGTKNHSMVGRDNKAFV
ncbi:unnamed protein product, partial [Owenia fusiformis]